MRQFIAAAALIAAVIIFTAACDTADSAFSADWRGETGESDSAGDKGNAERGNLSEKIDEKEISDLTAQCEAVVSMYCDIYPGEKGAGRKAALLITLSPLPEGKDDAEGSAS